ncbi:hypothetical protein C7I84_04400 [Mesorhizobium ephedrae]|uniref:Uncharacterized protein n=1 Tax=Kumtagia ephedrae TaxID=2116701 RepID=A0A2P7SQW0_9HYPH|nr:hypothetical protein C7I84_04400 [Mesorhizobium ephedrae]
MSLPSPPDSLSLPLSPAITSSPALPKIVLMPALPSSRSSKAEPLRFSTELKVSPLASPAFLDGSARFKRIAVAEAS